MRLPNTVLQTQGVKKVDELKPPKVIVRSGPKSGIEKALREEVRGKINRE